MKSIHLKSLMAVALLLGATPTFSQQAQPDLKNEVAPYVEPCGANWFLGIDAGWEWLVIHDNMTVINGSGLPSPLNHDTLTINKQTQGLLALEGGYRWYMPGPWFPALAVGMRYEYLFPTNIGGTVTQYSTPGFTNYIYNWKISSDVFLFTAKLNVFRFYRFLPYVSAGVGAAFNFADDYNETPRPGVTPRTSPNFSNFTRLQLGYSLGAGIDFAASNWVVGIGYEYQNLGHISSGKGIEGWSHRELDLGSYGANIALLSVRYLFDNN